MGRRAQYWLARNRMIFLARNRNRGHVPGGVGRELAWLTRAHLRPLAGALIRRRAGALDAGKQLGAVLVGEVAGVLSALRERRLPG